LIPRVPAKFATSPRFQGAVLPAALFASARPVQEICDHVGILHEGALVPGRPADELISIENQTELILENATPELSPRSSTKRASRRARGGETQTTNDA
jgi:hypothetical protein